MTLTLIICGIISILVAYRMGTEKGNHEGYKQGYEDGKFDVSREEYKRGYFEGTENGVARAFDAWTKYPKETGTDYVDIPVV